MDRMPSLCEYWQPRGPPGASDFGSGTSSRSTKLIHGGVRYLQLAVEQLDWQQFLLVKEVRGGGQGWGGESEPGRKAFAVACPPALIGVVGCIAEI